MSVEDTLTRRQVFIQRFAEGQAEEAEKVLRRIYAKAQTIIMRNPEGVTGQRLQSLTDDISRLLAADFVDLESGITQGVLDFADDQAVFAKTALEGESSVLLNTVNAQALEQVVLARGMDSTIGPSKLTLREALEKFSKNKTRELIEAINDGILLGETTPEISKRVQELAQNRPRHQVKTLVRTAINHARSMAELAVVEENSAFFQNEEWVATLDSRTTLICAGRDGNIYPLGQGPYPPAHWNCRSIRVPVLKDEFAVGDQGAKRKSEKGTVTGETKFDGWLKRQSAEFQDEYFSQFPDGKEKAALFRRGSLDIQQFRSETGVNYTLDDLRRLEPLAFRKANID